MHSLTTVLSGNPFTSLALVVVPWLIGRAFTWWKTECRRKRDEEEARAVRALEVGVNEAWESFGHSWKAAHADGKLSAEERESLRKHAREVALEVASGEGFDLAKLFGQRAVKLLIRKVVEGRKGKR